MSTPAHILASIPDEVLCPGGVLGRPRPSRVGALLRWCEARHIRPTLAEIEDERARRAALPTIP